MDQPKTFRVYQGNHIMLVGMPLVIVTVDRPGDDYGQLEFHLFVLKQPDGIHYVGRKIKFDGIPSQVMSDELLLERAVNCAEAELENYLRAKQAELKQLLANDRSFELKIAAPETFLYYVISRKLFDRARTILNHTDCKELEAFLQIVAQLKESSITTIDLKD